MAISSLQAYDQRAMDLEISAPDNESAKTGLAFWVQRVTTEFDRAALDFAPDPVHDLRVALRRCRSIAEGYAAFDPDQSWKEMRKTAGRLFKSLGELRDTQVMLEWVKKPGAPQDGATGVLTDHLTGLERDLKEAAPTALNSFDRKIFNRHLPVSTG